MNFRCLIIDVLSFIIDLVKFELLICGVLQSLVYYFSHCSSMLVDFFGDISHLSD